MKQCANKATARTGPSGRSSSAASLWFWALVKSVRSAGMMISSAGLTMNSLMAYACILRQRPSLPCHGAAGDAIGRRLPVDLKTPRSRHRPTSRIMADDHDCRNDDEGRDGHERNSDTRPPAHAAVRTAPMVSAQVDRGRPRSVAHGACRPCHAEPGVTAAFRSGHRLSGARCTCAASVCSSIISKPNWRLSSLPCADHTIVVFGSTQSICEPDGGAAQCQDCLRAAVSH